MTASAGRRRNGREWARRQYPRPRAAFGPALIALPRRNGVSVAFEFPIQLFNLICFLRREIVHVHRVELIGARLELMPFLYGPRSGP